MAVKENAKAQLISHILDTGNQFELESQAALVRYECSQNDLSVGESARFRYPKGMDGMGMGMGGMGMGGMGMGMGGMGGLTGMMEHFTRKSKGKDRKYMMGI